QALTTSQDFLKWTEPYRILAPDALDDEMARERIREGVASGVIPFSEPEDHRCEFYNLLIVPYEDVFIGLMMIFDPSFEFHRIGSNNQAGMCHTQLVMSRNLVDWTRLGDRAPFLTNGAPRDYDRSGAYYCCQPMLAGNEMLIV